MTLVKDRFSIDDILIAFLLLYEAILVFLMLGHGFRSLTLTMSLGYTSPIRNLEFWPLGLGLILFMLGLTFHPDTFETREKSVLFVIIGLFGAIIVLVGVWMNFAMNPTMPNLFIAMGSTLILVYWIYQVVVKSR